VFRLDVPSRSASASDLLDLGHLRSPAGRYHRNQRDFEEQQEVYGPPKMCRKCANVKKDRQGSVAENRRTENQEAVGGNS
jgi:hypothetical protein